MPSSPQTPTRRRRSSNIGVHLSFTSASPQSNDCSSKRAVNSRRSSQYSFHGRSDYLESSNGLDDPIDLGNANALGNLADELADALEDEEENEHGLREGPSEDLYDRTEAIRHDQLKENEHPVFRDSIQNEQAVQLATSDLSLSPPKQSSRLRHTRKSSQYDGSDYGDDSDLEITHSLVLEARLAAVEGLARRGTEANGSDVDEIVQRVADSLKDLGSQASLENGATR